MTDTDEGVMYYIMNWFVVRMPFVIILFFIVFAFVNSQLTVKDSTFDIESDIYSVRILASENGIAFKDSNTNRVYSGTIDLQRFNSEIVDAIFDSEEKGISGKLSLSYSDVNKDVVFNKKYYDRWAPYTGFANKYHSYVKWFYVLVEENGKMIPGTLRIELVRPVG